MKTLTLTWPSPLNDESLVDAREAAYTMNLPLYYLTNAALRKKLRVPHYHIGSLVRFRLSELAAWQTRYSEKMSGKGKADA